MYYLLDYENIGSLGLKGIDSLTDKDIVCIFYSENAHTIDLEAIEMFKSTKAVVKYIKVKKTAPNYADFQIVTLTGLILGKDSKEKVAIISNDKGYVAVIDYLKEDCVTGTNRIIELASTIADVKGSNRKMNVKDFNFDLPQELIAQDPLEDRSSSRLLVLDKKTGKTQHRIFKDIVEYLRPGDCLVINDT